MRSLVTACIAGALTLTSCEGRKPPNARASQERAVAPAPSEGVAGPATQEAFSRQVHTEALGALEALVDAYLSQVQPVFYASALGEPLAAPYAPGSREDELRRQLERIQKKMGEIRSSALEVQDERRLGAYRDMVNRDLWRLEGGNPSASDALAYLTRVGDLVVELRFRLLQDTPCEGCDDALADLPAALSRAERTLTAASRPNLAAAKARAETLARELEDLAALLDEGGRAKLATAAQALREYGKRVSALPIGPLADTGALRPWTEPVPTKREGKLEQRRDTWGTTHLESVFAKEENYSHAAGMLRPEAEAQLTRLRKMRKNLAERTQAPGDAKAGPAPVDPGRCETAWANMREFARSKGGFEPRLSCARLVQWLDGKKVDDETLEALLITEGLVPSSVHHQARGRGGLVAAIGGRWTRELARQYRTTMLAFPLANRSSGDAALATLESHICLAAVGIEVHSDSSDPGLDAWLAQWCPERKASAWRAQALGDPRGALVGIPAALLGPLPTDMVPVVEYGWAMYGTSLELSRPLDAPRPSAAPKPGYSIEPIDPAQL